MDKLDFIEDKELRKTLEDSMDYVYLLIAKMEVDDLPEGTKYSPFFEEETCRVIILYLVSFIEAVFLYLYKLRSEKFEYTEYRFVHVLPEEFTHNQRAGAVVVAVQEKVQKREHQIGLHDLALFFKDKGFLQAKDAKDILELNDVRNTFHFSKPRIRPCDFELVEFALQVVIRVLEGAPMVLRKS